MVQAVLRDCNWLQALEGDIDTSHLGFLHHGSKTDADYREGTFAYYAVHDRAPRYRVVDTEYGAMYAAYRPAGDGQAYWRYAQFLFPFYVMIPSGVMGLQIWTRAWVPMDDEHVMFFSMHHANTFAQRGLPPRALDPNASTPTAEAAALAIPMRMQPNTTDWLGRFRLVQNASNDYLIDGISTNDGLFQTPALVPPIDLIQEFKLQNGLYSSEFGMGAAQVSDELLSARAR